MFKNADDLDALVEQILDWLQVAPEERAARRAHIEGMSKAAFDELLGMAQRRAVLETVRQELAKHGLEGMI